jgi:hypothetical protein
VGHFTDGPVGAPAARFGHYRRRSVTVGAVWTHDNERNIQMRGKILFLAGLGVGYLIGTRAGREKYDQMVTQARKVWDSPSVQEAAGMVQSQAARLFDQGKQVVSDKIHKYSSKSDESDAEDSWRTDGRRDTPASAY